MSTPPPPTVDDVPPEEFELTVMFIALFVLPEDPCEEEPILEDPLFREAIDVAPCVRTACALITYSPPVSNAGVPGRSIDDLNPLSIIEVPDFTMPPN
jgi:hypothetical protein